MFVVMLAGGPSEGTASLRRRVIIVVDASKLSPILGSRQAVPVEVVAFGWRAQARYLESIGACVQLRVDHEQSNAADALHLGSELHHVACRIERLYLAASP